jgi:hypothetical protein
MYICIYTYIFIYLYVYVYIYVRMGSKTQLQKNDNFPRIGMTKRHKRSIYILHNYNTPVMENKITIHLHLY